MISSLIKDNLINLKLVSGPNHLGLIADNYYLNLGDTIFKLGFEASEQSDLIFETVLWEIPKKLLRSLLMGH